MRVAIVGCGRMGAKRANALCGSQLVACCDIKFSRAKSLADAVGGDAGGTWKDVVRRPDIDIVIVATPHNMLAPIACEAAHAGKHVLVEKPGACDLGGLAAIAGAAKDTGVLVHVGYSHRYHKCMWKAHQMCQSGEIGQLLYVRANYGHGGRPGYNKEWRADPKQSGGGELMDQGAHLIDLARWFLGGVFVEVKSFTDTCYWSSRVEDNVFLLLQTADKRVASLHASWTEWKNTFHLEIHGANGKIVVQGLGGSYGPERVTLYRKKVEGLPPEVQSWEYHSSLGVSPWKAEFADFLDNIRYNQQPSPGLTDAQAVLRVVESVYKENERDYS